MPNARNNTSLLPIYSHVSYNYIELLFRLVNNFAELFVQ